MEQYLLGAGWISLEEAEMTVKRPFHIKKPGKKNQ